jgi:hypothetical protein
MTTSDPAHTDLILQVLITKTDTGYQAHCLPMDIVTDADSVEQAMDDICDLIRAQYLYGRDTNNLESVFVPAPAADWQKLAHVKPTGQRTVDLTGSSEHAPEDGPSYLVQELSVQSAES